MCKAAEYAAKLTLHTVARLVENEALLKSLMERLHVAEFALSQHNSSLNDQIDVSRSEVCKWFVDQSRSLDSTIEPARDSEDPPLVVFDGLAASFDANQKLSAINDGLWAEVEECICRIQDFIKLLGIDENETVPIALPCVTELCLERLEEVVNLLQADAHTLRINWLSTAIASSDSSENVAKTIKDCLEVLTVTIDQLIDLNTKLDEDNFVAIESQYTSVSVLKPCEFRSRLRGLNASLRSILAECEGPTSWLHRRGLRSLRYFMKD